MGGKGMDTAEFAGPDRRHHKLYVTRNTEYHVRDGRVIAVRKRGSSEWLTDHSALDMTIQGRVLADSVVPQPGFPEPGDRLYLVAGVKSVVTSSIVAIERPPKEAVRAYPSLAA